MRTVLLCIILLAGWSTPVFNQQAKEITNSIGMRMVLIHPGSFAMGSSEEEKGRSPNETQHEVTISKPYYIGAYEVTQNKYEKLLGKNPSIHKGPKNPVEMVSWKDAVTFCKMLSDPRSTFSRIFPVPHRYDSDVATGLLLLNELSYTSSWSLQSCVFNNSHQ